MKSYSYLGQDIWITTIFNDKKDGFFIDIGASDGIKHNNTYVLEKTFEWKGICVEPNPILASQLLANRKCQISFDCIGEKSGDFFNFRLAGRHGGINNFLKPDEFTILRNKAKIINFTTVSLYDLFIKYSVPTYIDYLSLDTEGSEYEILKSFPFDKYSIGAITVENKIKEISSLLKEHNYISDLETGYENWFIQENLLNSLEP